MAKNLIDDSFCFLVIQLFSLFQGAKIIVYPENGLVGVFLDRFTVNAYLEQIPDPKDVQWNPSENPNAYNGTDMQRELSRIAKENKIYIVANMGTKKPCSPNEHHKCSILGQHQYNTNVVYSDDGTLIAVYHKYSLFSDADPFDFVQSHEYTIFNTPFGKFATVIGIELLSGQPTFILLEEYKIRNLVLTSTWVEITPLFRSIMVYSGFARANSVNLLVAGLHSVEKRLYGSGLFTPQGARAYSYETGKDLSKLLIADMDAISEDTPLSHSMILPQINPNIVSKGKHAHGSVFGMQFHFLTLSKSRSLVGLCSGDFCCSLKYEMQELTETYALGVGNGFISIANNRFYAQVCSLSKCSRGGNCVIQINEAKTIFKNFILSGHNYKTRQIAPQVVVMNKSSYALADQEWKYDYKARISVDKPMSKPLHSAVLLGRVYDKDHFYQKRDQNSYYNSAMMKHSRYVFVTMAILLCV